MMTNAIDMPIGTERFVRMHHLVGGIRKGAKVDAVKSVCCFAVDYHFTVRRFAGAADLMSRGANRRRI